MCNVRVLCHSWHLFTFNFQFIKCDFGIFWAVDCCRSMETLTECVYWVFPFLLQWYRLILTISKITRQWNTSNSTWIYNTYQIEAPFHVFFLLFRSKKRDTNTRTCIFNGQNNENENNYEMWSVYQSFCQNIFYPILLVSSD